LAFCNYLSKFVFAFLVVPWVPSFFIFSLLGFAKKDQAEI